MTKASFLKKLKTYSESLNKQLGGRRESIIDSQYAENEEKIEIFNGKRSLIEFSLLFCPDDFSLDGISSLEIFEEKAAFIDFVKNNGKDEIEKRLDAVLTEIKTLANAYASQNAKKLNLLNERQTKNHKIIFPLFIAGFIILSVIVIVFSALDACEYFQDNIVMSKVCAIVSSVAGALDAVNGVAFFVYERHDDKKKKEIQADADNVCGTYYNSGNTVIGKGHVLRVVINGGNPDCEYEKDGEEKLCGFIRAYNTKNKVKGKYNKIEYISE